jgi:hypothetical protein
MWGARNNNNNRNRGNNNNGGAAAAAHVLLFARTASSFRDLTEFLGALRIKYKTSAAGRNLPDLIKLSRGGAGKYFLIIFEDVRDFYRMDKWNREILEKYCRQFRAGILGFLPSSVEPGGDAHNETLPDVVRRTTAPFRSVYRDLKHVVFVRIRYLAWRVA